jgi:hypothetical protein
VDDNAVINAAVSQRNLLFSSCLADVTPAAVCFDDRNVVCFTASKNESEIKFEMW